ncbi:hypothetical protein RNZ50_10095 [Paracoccaceae bacterium Fryx2]|nr:hypothetical protein [Paracoccaceae bacterium Fryx2]
MMDGDFLPPAILQRKAVVYVRQSTQAQVKQPPAVVYFNSIETVQQQQAVA